MYPLKIFETQISTAFNFATSHCMQTFIRLKQTVKYLAHCSSERFETALGYALTTSSGVSNFVPVNYSFTVGKRKQLHGAKSGVWVTNWMGLCGKRSII